MLGEEGLVSHASAPLHLLPLPPPPGRAGLLALAVGHTAPAQVTMQDNGLWVVGKDAENRGLQQLLLPSPPSL